MEGPIDGGDPPIEPVRGSTPSIPSIATSALPNATIGVAYAQQVVVESGTAPYSFSVVAGSLPAGLAIDPVAGIISGTPTASGINAFFVQVIDANGYGASAALSIIIPAQPVIANTSLPAGTVGIPYFGSLTGNAGSPPYGFEITSGGLPEGLTLATTGGITGTPTTAGNFTVTIQIYDSGDPQGIGSATFTIAVRAASLANPVATMEECLLIGSPDGGLYVTVPGQHYDEDYLGNQQGIAQVWDGVPGTSQKQAQLQVGGATVSAKGNGLLNISVTDNLDRTTPLTNERRVVVLSSEETVRDISVVGLPTSERFGTNFDNGSLPGAWFELHSAILWVRTLFTGRKA